VKSLNLPHYGQVGAGKSVLQFPQLVTQRNITIPEHISNTYKKLILFDVSGESLAFEKISDGDTLICNPNFELENITVAQICVLMLYGNELIAKHLCFDKNGRICLSARNSEGKIACFTVEPEQVEVLAVVVGLYRSMV
jgi:SOS-response transcriptional repressor LexA